MPNNQDLPLIIKDVLSSRSPEIIDDNQALYRHAAVLIPIFRDNGEYKIIFTKRTNRVEEHKGQISFPGGTREEADRTLLDTALREYAEETGLRAEDIEVLGELDDEATITSNYIVSPFVAVIPWPSRFNISKGEVDEIIEVPISALLDKESLQQGTEFLDGKMVDSYAYHYQGKIIWGATARILNRFLGIVTRAMQDK